MPKRVEPRYRLSPVSKPHLHAMASNGKRHAYHFPSLLSLPSFSGFRRRCTPISRPITTDEIMADETVYDNPSLHRQRVACGHLLCTCNIYDPPPPVPPSRSPTGRFGVSNLLSSPAYATGNDAVLVPVNVLVLMLTPVPTDDGMLLQA